MVFIFSVLFSLVSYPASGEVASHSLYGESIQFDVIRNDEKVGEHITSFQKEGDRLIVTSKMDLSISILSIPFYQFTYQAKEIWEKDHLVKLDIALRDGRDKIQITGTLDQNSFLVEKIENDQDIQKFRLPAPLHTTNHWNHQVLNETMVLNTLTGRLNKIELRKTQIDTLLFKDIHLTATQYEYIGDLKDTWVWYDQKGRWVKLAFIARDGSRIEYLCTNCIKEEINS